MFMVYIYKYIYMQSWKQCALQLSPQWLCGNSCTWAHGVQLHITRTNEPKSAQQAKHGAQYALYT